MVTAAVAAAPQKDRGTCVWLTGFVATLARYALSYPMFIIMGTSFRMRDYHTWGRALALNLAVYTLPYMALMGLAVFHPSFGTGLGTSWMYFAICYLATCLAPVLLNLCFKVQSSMRAHSGGRTIPVGTFCFRPAFRFRLTTVNLLAVGGMTFEFFQLALFLLPPPLAGGGGASAVLRQVLEGMGLPPRLYTVLFWSCVGVVVVQLVIILLRVVLTGQAARHLAGSRLCWIGVSLVSGPLFIAIVVALIKALVCNYEPSPPVLFAAPEVVCWRGQHIFMVGAALGALAVYVPQAALMPAGTYKETMKNGSLDVLFVPLYLEAHVLLKAFFAATFVFFQNQETRWMWQVRAVLMLAIIIALGALNGFVAPSSLEAINVLRSTALVCCLWVACVSLILVTTGDSDDPQEVLRQGTAWGAPTIIAGWLLLACIYYSQHRESIRHTALFKVAETLNDMRLAQIETTKMRPRSLETLVALTGSNNASDLTTAVWCIPTLAELLSHENPIIQFQACWCITNLARVSDKQLEKQKVRPCGQRWWRWLGKLRRAAEVSSPVLDWAISSAATGGGGSAGEMTRRRSKFNNRIPEEHLLSLASMRDATVESAVKAAVRATLYSAPRQHVSGFLRPGTFESIHPCWGGSSAAAKIRTAIRQCSSVLPRLFELARGTEVVHGKQVAVPGLLRVQAFGTLVNLAADPRGAAAMADDHDAVQLFTAALNDDSFLAPFAALGLASLAQTEPNRERIRAEGAVPLLIAGLLSLESIELSKHSCLALANLSLSEPRHASVFLAGELLSRLTEVLAHSWRGDGLRNHVCLLLSYLALSGNNELLLAMVREGVLDGLQRVRGVLLQDSAVVADMRRMRHRFQSLGKDEGRAEYVLQLFENQSWSPLRFRWVESSQTRGALTHGDGTGSYSREVRASDGELIPVVAPPAGWVWSDEWTANREGWGYASMWGLPFTHKPGPLHFVRRRIWRRTLVWVDPKEQVAKVRQAGDFGSAKSLGGSRGDPQASLDGASRLQGPPQLHQASTNDISSVDVFGALGDAALAKLSETENELVQARLSGRAVSMDHLSNWRPRLRALNGTIAWDMWPSAFDSFSWMRTCKVKQDDRAQAHACDSAMSVQHDSASSQSQSMSVYGAGARDAFQRSSLELERDPHPRAWPHGAHVDLIKV
jgi:hypothetical protein